MLDYQRVNLIQAIRIWVHLHLVLWFPPVVCKFGNDDADWAASCLKRLSRNPAPQKPHSHIVWRIVELSWAILLCRVNSVSALAFQAKVLQQIQQVSSPGWFILRARSQLLSPSTMGGNVAELCRLRFWIVLACPVQTRNCWGWRLVRWECWCRIIWVHGICHDWALPTVPTLRNRAIHTCIGQAAKCTLAANLSIQPICQRMLNVFMA